MKQPTVSTSDRPIDKLMVTRREAAYLLSVSVEEIDRRRRSGDLTSQRCGSKILISTDELRRFADTLPLDED